jgi:hypothetical protein
VVAPCAMWVVNWVHKVLEIRADDVCLPLICICRVRSSLCSRSHVRYLVHVPSAGKEGRTPVHPACYQEAYP